MSRETTKSNLRRKDTWLFNKVFSGKGIDIGPEKDPLRKEDFPNITNIETFDREHGDANFITHFRQPKSYDFVYSSNCLEHMENSLNACMQWWLLVKLDGYMIITVPDEDLYEQGRFKAKPHWSKDHKWTFTIYKKKSWSTRSINVLNMIKLLPDCQTIKVELVDTNYDYSIPWGSKDQTKMGAETFIEIVLRKVKGYGM